MPASLKFGRANNIQNSVQFQTTSDFDSKWVLLISPLQAPNSKNGKKNQNWREHF